MTAHPYALKITDYIAVPVHRVVAAKPPDDGPALFGRSLEDILDMQYGRVTWPIWLRIDGFDLGPVDGDWFTVLQPHARAWWDLLFPSRSSRTAATGHSGYIASEAVAEQA